MRFFGDCNVAVMVVKVHKKQEVAVSSCQLPGDENDAKARNHFITIMNK